MTRIARVLLPAIGLSALLFLAGSAYAQCCKVSRSHQVRVPSVAITRPHVDTGGCSSQCGGCGDKCAPPPQCNEDCGGKKRGREGEFSGRFGFDFEVSATAAAQAAANSAAQARSNAFANSVAFGLGGAINGSAGFGAGGGGGTFIGSSSTYVPSLNVEAEAAAAAVTVPYQATRTIFKTMVIHAVCIDDKLIPHAASQVRPDREVAESYEGELFRCLAGTRLQYTLSEQAAAAGGESIMCAKGEALHHAAGGKLSCRPQTRARDCNERSLLRRYGAGVKVVRLAMVETYTAFRTETAATASASASAGAGIQLDGGVGGIIF